MINKIIPALDGMNREEVITFLERIQNHFSIVKIGMELFYKEGPDFVKEIHRDYGFEVFLDLKLYDIPNTVAGAIKSLQGLPIKFLTIHLSGGEEMVTRAISQARESIPSTKLLGVSYLTSLDDSYFHQVQGINQGQIQSAFDRLFTLADKTKIDGIVCSPLELDQVQSYSFHKVCPGVRFEDEIKSGNIGDQKRVLTPYEAINKGADFLVMGRSLRKDDLSTRVNELEKSSLFC